MDAARSDSTSANGGARATGGSGGARTMGGAGSGGVLKDAGARGPDASSRGGGTGGTGGATGGAANTTGGATNTTGGNANATGGRDASASGGTSGATGGADGSTSAGGSRSTGGALSTGGTSGTCGAPVADAGQPKPECYVNAECPTGLSCTGQRPSKLCVPDTDYCDSTDPTLRCVQHSTGCVNHRCLPPLPLGAACTRSQECDPSQYCGEATDGCTPPSCAPNPVEAPPPVSSGTCVPHIDTLSTCLDSVQCDQTGSEPTLCYYSGDYMQGQYVCRPPGREGARCNFGACTFNDCYECDVGFMCLPDPHNVDPFPESSYSWVSRCTSHLPGTLDAYCGFDPALSGIGWGVFESCQPGLYCKETHVRAFPGDDEIFQCEPAPKRGEPCSGSQQVFDRLCDRGLYCDYVAPPDGGPGAPTCRALKPGDPCDQSQGDCGPGLACVCSSSVGGTCFGEWCQPAARLCEQCGDATHTLPCESGTTCGSDHLCHSALLSLLSCSTKDVIECPDETLYCSADSRCQKRAGIGEPCVVGSAPYVSVGGDLLPLGSDQGALCARGLRCVDGFLDGSCH
jgi:hypothetical protein